ncbi:copper chaperone PCu(A)C [Erythrobacter sp. JK5]|nr:copper chaperone PCu(A)C [Erythrobacter sp. JK5]
MLALAGALAGAIALGACSDEPPPVEKVEGVVPGLTISNARMMLAPVEGNPAAVYFDATYEGERGISISGAEVAGAANATVHDMMEYNFEMTMAEAGPIAITNGSELNFEPGALHIMAFEPSADLQPGGKAEVTLKISGGARHKFQADILAAGDER